jgi:hypothetical protein
MERVALVRAEIFPKEAPAFTVFTKVATINFILDAPIRAHMDVYAPVLAKVKEMLGDGVVVLTKDVTWELDYEEVKHKGIKI